MTAEPSASGPRDSADARAAASRADVLRAIESVEQGERSALDNLRESLCAFVGALRGVGCSRERTLEEVRVLVASPSSPEGAFSLLGPAREALVELSLHWCIEEFDAGEQKTPARSPSGDAINEQPPSPATPAT